MGREFKLGIFMIICLVGCVWIIFRIKDIRLEKGYRLHIYFNDTGGIAEKSWVRSSGVKIGKVESISLDKGRAKVTVWIWGKYKIHSDAKVRIISTGLLGVKYLDITSGSEDKPLLKDGDKIDGIEPVSIEKVISIGFETLNRIGELFDPSVKNNLFFLLDNMAETMGKVSTAVEGEKVRKIVENIYDLSARLNQTGKDVNRLVADAVPKIDNTVDNIAKASDEVRNIIREVKSSTETLVGAIIHDREIAKDVKNAILSLKRTSEHAENVISRIRKISSYWNYMLRYNTIDNVVINDFGIYIYPQEKKFYYLGVNNIFQPDYGTMAGVTATAAERFNTFTGLVGYELIPSLSLYGGVIRSYAGIGILWEPVKIIDLEGCVFAFSRRTPSIRPYFILSTRINLVPWLFIGLQVEDMLAFERLKCYPYVKICLYDEDITYLLGLIGLAKP